MSMHSTLTGNWAYAASGSLALFSSDAARNGLVAAEIEAAGWRVARRSSLEEALHDPAGFGAADVVLVDVRPGDVVDELVLARLLDRLDAAAAAGQFVLLVDVPLGLIDMAEMRLTSPRSMLLCGATPLDRAAALSLATASRAIGVCDIGGEASAARLRQLSEEVGRIARTLASLSAGPAVAEPPATPRPSEPAEPAEDPAEMALTVRAILRARRLRDQFFPADIFSDPAWDMLLDLMASRLEAKRVAVSSLCIAAAVPATTALRWIKALTDEGLFIRRADPSDGRRVFIDLSEAAVHGMRRYLGQLRRIGDLPV